MLNILCELMLVVLLSILLCNRNSYLITCRPTWLVYVTSFRSAGWNIGQDGERDVMCWCWSHLVGMVWSRTCHIALVGKMLCHQMSTSTWRLPCNPLVYSSALNPHVLQLECLSARVRRWRGCTDCCQFVNQKTSAFNQDMSVASHWCWTATKCQSGLSGRPENVSAVQLVTCNFLVVNLSLKVWIKISWNLYNIDIMGIDIENG